MRKKILILNNYEYLNFLNADSSYTLTKSFINEALAADEHLSIKWVLPSNSTLSWEPDLDHERLEIIKCPYLKSRDANEIVPQWFDAVNPFFGRHCDYHLVICNNAGLALRMTELLQFIHNPIPVIIWEFYTKTLGRGAWSQQNVANVQMHALAHALAEVTWYQSEWEMKNAVRMAQKFLSPKLQDRVIETGRAVTIACNTKALDAIKTTKPKKPTLYFGGRFTKLKAGEVAVQVYDYLYKLGFNIDIEITVPHKKVRRLETVELGKDELRIHKGLLQSEAWEVMKSCTHSIYPGAQINSLPGAFFEQVYSGLVVFAQKKNSEMVLPSNYPYLFTTIDEAVLGLKKCLESNEKADPCWAKMAEDKFGVCVNTQSMLKDIDMASKKSMPRKSGKYAKELKERGFDSWAICYEWLLRNKPIVKATKRYVLTQGTRVNLNEVFREWSQLTTLS